MVGEKGPSGRRFRGRLPSSRNRGIAALVGLKLRKLLRHRDSRRHDSGQVVKA
jgi:hypothetical protein